ncbi:hypothetical protein BpHYR1_040773 [Brachionus plicatilis]|uniref:Uncharacterized protein n=1 Tax=Brachionus plicatilis TaxID=10195 RepID=A0A3M7SFZ7_BRAPC|nr:hypothetical protein BpHYR1_040773 [Brachionus plicatilis]
MKTAVELGVTLKFTKNEMNFAGLLSDQKKHCTPNSTAVFILRQMKQIYKITKEKKVFKLGKKNKFLIDKFYILQKGKNILPKK